jgi:peptide/nickel transport system permease protein
MAPPEASQADIAVMRNYLGLDRPWPVQYWNFISRAVQGDFGKSVRFRRPAMDLILERYGATLELGGLAVLIVIVVALPVGVYAAVRRNTPLDYAARAFAALGQAVPPFWLGLLLVLVFGVILRLLPTSGRGTPLHVLLPGITLGWFAVAGLMRLTRSSMLDVLGSEYVKLARIKGLPERTVIWKHAFKNAALPVVTFAALLFVALLNGSIIVETVFGWPGLGLLVAGPIAAALAGAGAGAETDSLLATPASRIKEPTAITLTTPKRKISVPVKNEGRYMPITCRKITQGTQA